MDQPTHAACHCGAVRIALPRPPDAVTECGCTLCRAYGTLWAYYRTADVTLAGPTDPYVWGRKRIVFHRCSTCGCILGWWPRGDYPECGINARLVEGLDLAGVTRFFEEDASE